MTAQMWIAILVGLAATANDLYNREIADWIPISALVAGLGWHLGLYGWMGSLYALGGSVAGLAAFLVFYLLGGMGGGDIKLMAGYGSLLGTWGLVSAALWTAGTGGLIAATVLGWRALRRRMGSTGSGGTDAQKESVDAQSIPYAPAIAVGVWLSLTT